MRKLDTSDTDTYRKIHSMICATSFRLLVPPLSVCARYINLKIRTTIAPANPMKKLNTITNMLQALGVLNRNVMMYLKLKVLVKELYDNDVLVKH